jgi:hypothetical protein
MEQLMESLVVALEKVVTNEDKMDVILKEMKASQEWMITKMDAHQEGMDSHHEKMMAIMEACLEKMEAMDLEENPERTESDSEQQEVPKDEFAVKITGVLEDRYGDQHLAVGRSQ